eukprot:scaffold15361_cov18-Prasinocladus_malaysianus.AAC.1
MSLRNCDAQHGYLMSSPPSYWGGGSCVTTRSLEELQELQPPHHRRHIGVSSLVLCIYTCISTLYIRHGADVLDLPAAIVTASSQHAGVIH